MKPTRALLIACIAAFCLAADGPPSMQEIQQDLQAQKYQDVLKKVAAALQLKGNAAAGYDRAGLWKLKGEAHLQLKQGSPSADAFSNGAKESKDEKEVGYCTAMAMLVKRSNNGMYTPKQPTTRQSGGKPAGIDILTPESRKEALLALFNDESKTSLSKVDALKRQKTLKPVMEGIRDLANLRSLELAATESDATTKGALSQLGTHANGLMAEALKTMATKVDQIGKQANETHSSQQTLPDGRVQVVTSKRGLTSVDQSALKDVIATCKNISTACDEFAQALGSEGAGFTGTSQQSQQLSAKADQVLRADYSPDIKGQGGAPTVPRNPTRPPGGNYR